MSEPSTERPEDRAEAERISAALETMNKTSPAGECLTGEELSEFLDGRASESRRKQFLAHLSTCSICQRGLVRLHEETKIALGREARDIQQDMSPTGSAEKSDTAQAAETPTTYRVHRPEAPRDETVE